MGSRRRVWEPAPVALVTGGIRAAAAAALVVGGLNALWLPPAEAAAKPCTIVGTSGDDLLRGTDGKDVICALGGDDKVLGLGGDDVIRGGGGDDVLRGGPGDDVVAGGRGDDRIFGQGGDDVARGDAGDDQITGGPGSDRMGGFKGADVLRGLDGSGSVDDMRCGPGPDSASGDPSDRIRRDCESVEQNDPPTDITLDPASISENEFEGTDIGDLSTNDPDPGDEITFALVPGPGSADNGLVDIDGDALESAAEYDFETTPELSVRIRATDAAGESVEEAFLVTVVDENDPPVAVDDDAVTAEDTALELPLSGAGSPAANDTDQDGDALSVSAVSSPTGGTVTKLSDVIRFEPNANLCGTDAGSFVYTVTDGNGGTDTGTVTVDITCVDDDPTAVDDDRTVAEDAAATLLGVRANDVDPESDAITITGITQPDHGSTVVDLVSGDVLYTPDADYCNSPPPFDTFDYTVNGGDTATVRVTVTCTNDAPVAVDDDRATTEDTALVDPATGAGSPAANDTDVDGDTRTVTSVSNPVGGTVVLAAGQITFTPTADLCGSNAGSYDYVVGDGNGGTDTGSVTIDITCVDDPPVANDDSRTVDEDSGPTVFGTLLANDTDVESDPITITDASNPPNGSTSFTGTDVTYTPDADFCGADSFTYTVNGGDTATVSVTVTCANDAPVVDLDSTTAGNGSTATFTETDPHTGTGVLIAPDVDIADADDTVLESATVTLTNRPDGSGESIAPPATLPAGITVNGSTGPGGQELVLTGPASIADFETAIAGIRYDNTVNPPDASDRTITVVVNDGDADSVSRTASVQVVPLNVPPVNTVPESATTAEDTSLTFTSGLSISVDDADDANLAVEVSVTQGTFATSGTSGLTVTGNGTATVSISGPVADINAALNNGTYTPAANYSGPAQLTIVTDDGADTDTDSVDITVTPVNDAPTASNLDAGETYTEDTTKNLVDIVVSDVDSATVTATLTLSNAAAGVLTTATSGSTTSTFGSGVWSASGPVADVNVLLAGVGYVPAADFNASFAITTSVSDGALDATGSKAMTGTPVNDAPTSTAPGAQTTDEDVSKAITGLSVADIDNASLTVTLSVTNGTLTLASLTGLSFGAGDGTADATMTFSGSVANLNTAIAAVTYAPTANFNGASALTFATNDGGAPVSKTVDITVTPVNDAPVADDETFNGANSAIGNTSLVVDSPADGAPTVTGPRRAVTGDILAGDTDVDGDALTVQAGTVTSNDGGTVTIQSDGDFVFLPDDDAGCGDGSDFFNYTVTDASSPSPGTDIGTVTLAITDCVWYVDGAAPAGGDGRSSAPFNGLGSLNAASGVGDSDDAADYLFVYGGSFSAGLPLEQDQRLFGQPQGLVVDGTTLVAAGGVRPNIYNMTVGGAGIGLANGVEVRGVNAGQTGAGSSLGIRGVAVTTATVGANVEIAGNGIGFALQGAAGGDVSVAATISGNNGAAVSIQQRSSGTVTVSGDVTASGLNTTVEAANNTGATVNITGRLDLSGGAQTGLDLRQGGTFSVTNPANTITGLAGPLAVGVNLDGITVAAAGIVVNTLSTDAGGAGTGLSVNNVAGTGPVTVNGGSLVTGTRGVDVNGGSGDVTVGASINPTGGRSVEVTGHTSGTVDLNGAVIEDATGINLTGNTGSTVRFDGGLTASTGASAAFNATGGGTVVVTGAANTLTTTTGTPLNVTSTSIGANGLTFRSIASTGAASGIVLSATGSAGGLTVAGNGGTCSSPATCSGGAIQSSTGKGISLSNVGGGVSLTRMSVNGGADDGIDGSAVTGLTVASSRVVNNGNAADEDGISLSNAAGAVSVTGTEVTGSAYNNLRVQNTSGTITSLTLSGSKFSNNSQTTGNHGALVDIGGTSTLTTGSVSSSEFRDNFSIGLQVVANGSATIGSFTVDGNTFAGTSTGATTGTQEIALDASKSGTSSATFLIQNNTVTGHNSHGMNVFSGAGAGTGGQLRARLVNNTIGSAVALSSGSQIGNCLRVNLNGDSADTVLVGNNVLRQCPNGRGIEVIGRNGTGLKDVTVTGNDVTPNDTSGFPLSAILVQSNCVTVCATLRADVRANTVPAGSSFDLGTGFLALIETGASTLQLVDSAPASADCAGQLASTNTGSTSASTGCALIAGPIGTPP